jgi:hypothetical protein
VSLLGLFSEILGPSGKAAPNRKELHDLPKR